MEKRKLFHVFLKQFVDVHNKWEPIITGELTDRTSPNVSDVENSLLSGDSSVGCFSGHPTEFIITLIDEITQMTSIVTKCKLMIFCYSSFSFFLKKVGAFGVIINLLAKT